MCNRRSLFDWLFPRFWLGFEHTVWNLPSESVAAFFKLVIVVVAIFLILGLATSGMVDGGSPTAVSTVTASSKTTVSSAQTPTASSEPEAIWYSGQQITVSRKAQTHTIYYWFEPIGKVTISVSSATTHSTDVTGTNGWTVTSKVRGDVDEYIVEKDGTKIHIWSTYVSATTECITYTVIANG